jgi:hypothetical protein
MQKPTAKSAAIAPQTFERTAATGDVEAGFWGLERLWRDWLIWVAFLGRISVGALNESHPECT